jgi:hypothetical protein
MVVIQSSELIDLFKSYDEMSIRECRVHAPHSACTVRFTGFTMDKHVKQHSNMRFQLICCALD